MNKLELGVQATATVADAAIVKPNAPATNSGLVWNGTNWIAAALVNANIDAAAAIAYSKLNLAGAIVNNDIAVGAAIAQSKLANGPGFEIGYDQIVATVTVISATEATGTTVISCGAHTFDGSAVLAEFFSPSIAAGAAAGYLVICLFEGVTEIGRLAVVEFSATTMNVPVPGRLRFTPTAGSHTYTVTAFYITTTSPVIGAGAGGTGTQVPAYIRFTKV